MSERSVRVGCAGFPPRLGRSAYFGALELLEFEGLYDRAMKPAALRTWREATPARAGYSLVAPRALGDAAFASTSAVSSARDVLLQAAELLAAEVVVLRTPTSFTPSAAHREALATFVAKRIAGALPDGCQLVWEPRGMWEPGVAHALAESFGGIVAVDPLANDPLGHGPPPLGDTAYIRLSGLGSARRQFSSDQLEVIADELEAIRRAWVVFANIDSYRDARRFRALVADRTARDEA